MWWIVNPLLGNAFPVAREGSVRPSLENMGRIMDNGWSVLIYPEGELTVGGPIKPFMHGTGLVAVEGSIPVVPLRLHVHSLGIASTAPFAQTRQCRGTLRPTHQFPAGNGLPRSHFRHRRCRKIPVREAG